MATGETESVRVLVIDECRYYSAGLVDDLDQLGLVASHSERDPVAWAITERRPMAVLLTDRPSRNLRMLPQLDALGPSVTAVALLSHMTAEAAAQALRLGASGVALVSDDSKRIASSIQRATQGEVVLEGNIARQLAVSAALPPSAMTLGPEELLIARRLADGASTREIAKQMQVSERTAYRRVRSLLNILGAGSRDEAENLAQMLLE